MTIALHLHRAALGAVQVSNYPTIMDTQLKTFEVFHQSKYGEPHVHVGAVHAPDAELALQFARDQFARRLECVNLWVVPSDQITATTPEEAAAWFEPATDKSYREASGFPMRDILKRAEQWNDNDKMKG